MNEAQQWKWLAAVLVLGWLVYLLSPILTPFLAGALFAYLGDPLADRLEARKMPRIWAVATVFAGMTLVVMLLLGFLVPALVKQVQVLIDQLPRVVDWLQHTVLPFIAGMVGLESEAVFDSERVKGALAKHWREAGSIAALVVDNVSRSGLALLAWVANLVLIPVVTFYLLRDWDVLMERVRACLPRDKEAVVVGLVKESDEVLGAFLRGQFMVMLALGVVYSLGLSIVGLDLAILIGMIAGLVSFVPYLGFIVGIVAATIAAWLQFQAFLPLLGVLATFTVGQLLEGMWLTPTLVGDKIGLHPVAVIFAIMAGGQLFGFVGVLLALPVASVVMVFLRHAYQRYLGSEMYGRTEES